MICKWVCDAKRIGGAEFVNRVNGQRAVLHPSTKRKGWQVSFFDDRGAISDIIAPDCTTALDNAGVTPAVWKLKAVEHRR